MNNLIIWGASGHAKVIVSCVDKSAYNIVAFIDRNKNLKEFNEVSVYNHWEDFLESHCSTHDLYFIIAIGGNKGKERIKIHQFLVEQGLKPLTFIHPNAWVDKTAVIKDGAQILGMAAVSAGAVIGIQTIVNTNATIDHEVQVGNGCHIMPAATIAGCCIINDYCTVGSNATVLPRLELFGDTMIGAGAVVTKSTKKKGVFVGVPAREVV